MEPVSNNSELDKHIRETLKKDDTDLPPIDWSEIDVLLYHEKKSVLTGIKINKKNIFIFSAVVVSIIILLGAVKIVSYYFSANSEKTESNSNPAPNSFDVVDSNKNILIDSISKNNNDLVNAKQQTDSIIGNSPTNTTSVINTQKQEKRKKLNTISQSPINTDTAVTKTEATDLPVINTETISTPPIEENSTIPTTIDTINKDNSSNKSNSLQKKIFRRKNRKAQKTDTLPGEIKPDSLK